MFILCFGWSACLMLLLTLQYLSNGLVTNCFWWSLQWLKSTYLNQGLDDLFLSWIEQLIFFLDLTIFETSSIAKLFNFQITYNLYAWALAEDLFYLTRTKVNYFFSNLTTSLVSPLTRSFQFFNLNCGFNFFKNLTVSMCHAMHWK